MSNINDRIRRFQRLLETKSSVNRVPETFGERLRKWAKNSLALRLLIFSPFFYFFIIFLNQANAFDFPWFKDSEKVYNEAVELRIESEKALINSLISEFRARGDLSFDKAQVAAEEQNSEELNRLANVAREMKSEMNRLILLRDKKTEYNFRFCLEKDGEEHCFSRALLK